MPKQKYKMSFSVGGIFYQESLAIADLYLKNNDWNFVRREVLKKNLLQSRTESSAKRIIREVISRLSLLGKEELELLSSGNRSDQNCILWMAVCRNYQFIREFSREVIRENFLNFQYVLNYENYDVFFNRKAEWCPKLDGLSQTTKGKLRQVLFKMLREVDIIDKDQTIKPIVLSPQLTDIMRQTYPEDLCIFPTINNL